MAAMLYSEELLLLICYNIYHKKFMRLIVNNKKTHACHTFHCTLVNATYYLHTLLVIPYSVIKMIIWMGPLHNKGLVIIYGRGDWVQKRGSRGFEV